MHHHHENTRTPYRRPVPPPRSQVAATAPAGHAPAGSHPATNWSGRSLWSDEPPRGIRFVAGYLTFSVWMIGLAAGALVTFVAWAFPDGAWTTAETEGFLLLLVVLAVLGVMAWLTLALRRKILEGRNWPRAVLTGLLSCGMVGSLRTAPADISEAYSDWGSVGGTLFAVWCLFWLGVTVALIYHLWTDESSEHFHGR